MQLIVDSRRFLVPALSLTLALGACQAPDRGNPSLDTESQRASYGIGLRMGSQLQVAESRVDMSALVAGVRDGVSGAEPRLSEEEIQMAIQAFSDSVRVQEESRMAAEAEENLTEGAAFLAENAQKDGVLTTESGLQYEVLREGDGATPSNGVRVSIHYRGTLLDGTEFDSSYERGEPAVFPVGGVIPGFAEGLMLMPVGSQYRFFIPSGLAYGPQGSPPTIGPNATLVFEVELLEIVE